MYKSCLEGGALYVFYEHSANEFAYDEFEKLIKNSNLFSNELKKFILKKEYKKFYEFFLKYDKLSDEEHEMFSKFETEESDKLYEFESEIFAIAEKIALEKFFDLYEKKAVRLYKGDYAQMTVYNDDPVAVAKDFQAAGSKHIHLVDLEGAKSGIPENLTTIKTNNLLEHIGKYCFANCSNIENIYLPYSLKSMGEAVFYNCANLQKTNIPDSIKYIPAGSFSKCPKLEKVTLHNKIIAIEEYAFAGCDNLIDVYYSGIEEEWNEINISDYNEPLLKATIHYAQCEHNYNFFIH